MPFSISLCCFRSCARCGCGARRFIVSRGPAKVRSDTEGVNRGQSGGGVVEPYAENARCRRNNSVSLQVTDAQCSTTRRCRPWKHLFCRAWNMCAKSRNVFVRSSCCSHAVPSCCSSAEATKRGNLDTGPPVNALIHTAAPPTYQQDVSCLPENDSSARVPHMVTRMSCTTTMDANSCRWSRCHDHTVPDIH